jgi:twitching motility protein PilT
MALVDSLLSAIVRADGDALVMHVGERPYVVVGTLTINISTHGLNLEAMTGMLTQLLPADAQTQLEEFGAVEYRIPQQGEDRFSVVAARGGEDIWIEIRRRRPAAAAQPKAESAPAPPASSAVADVLPPTETPDETPPAAATEPIAELIAEPIAEPVAEAAPAPISEPVADVAPETTPGFAQEMPAAPVAAPELAAEPHGHVEAAPNAYDDWIAAAAIGHVDDAVAQAPAIAETAREAQTVAPVEHALEPESEIVQATEASTSDVVAVPANEPIAEPATAAQVEEQPAFVEEPTFAEATVDKPMIAALDEPVLEVIDEEEEVVAVAETAAATPMFAEAAGERSTFGEAAVVKPMFAEAAAQQPATETQPPFAASIEPSRIETPQVDLPHVHAPPPPVSPAPGLVLPLTRTVRIEVPARTVPARAASGVDRLLRIATARGATALFLTSESRPWMRLDGDLRYLDSEALLSRADVENAILEISPESGQESIGPGEGTEWIADFENVGRVRCTTFTDHRGQGVLLRLIVTKAATAEQLGLAQEVQALATESQGLVLVTGPRAGGKSTLLSALVDLVNRQRAGYVVTLERQIRLVHDNKQALISQREIRGGADDLAAAVRAALRENPDVLVVDDLVSPAMVPLLLTAASDGLLVFVSITAPSTTDAVARFVELAPPETRKAAQNAMAESFRGAVGQVLLKKSGGGVLAAREVLLESRPVSRVISEGQFGQLPVALESGRKYGMVSFNDVLIDSVRTGAVDVREAFRKTHDRESLLESLKRSGFDTSAVERLA